MPLTKAEAIAACEAVLTDEALGALLLFVARLSPEELSATLVGANHGNAAVVKYLSGLMAEKERAEAERAAQREAAVAGPSGATVDNSSRIVEDMLKALLVLNKLPENAEELAAILQDRTGLRIPVTAATTQHQLGSLQQLLNPMGGEHSAAVIFSGLLELTYRRGNESTTTSAMFSILDATFTVLDRAYSHTTPLTLINNSTEKKVGSRSCAVPLGKRPDTLVIHDMATLLFGEDKAADLMHEAIEDLKQYGSGGLAMAQYGSVPGILGYAASGPTLRFCYINKDGKVTTAGESMDMSTASGRLQIICCVVQAYRIMRLISSKLPRAECRVPLWKVMQRSPAQVMLTPLGAVKTIPNKSFCADYGVTAASLTAAYKAAGAAAVKQKRNRQRPFLVHTAPSSKLHFGQSSFSVQTSPLGYARSIDKEQDARQAAWACLMAARELHGAKIVHTDFRESNLVWLGDNRCMVIDLEHCRSATQPLPHGCPHLADWDDGTLQQRSGRLYFTPASDVYQIGLMLQRLCKPEWSPEAHDFVRMLLSKRPSPGAQGSPHEQQGLGKRKRGSSRQQQQQELDAHTALQHAWMRGEPR